MSPYGQRPIDHGADVVMQSSTKSLSGHSDLLGGVLTTNDKKLDEKLHFILKATGAVPSPFDNWILLRSTKTLSLRYQRSCDNAMKIAEWLNKKNLTKKLLNNMGITTTFYNPNLTNKIKELITNKTKLIFMESPGSLTFEIQNISIIVDIAKKYNLITVIDNTWATSLYLKPMNYGVDISIQSATKYIVGHSDAMLGVITTNKKYAKQIRESAHNLGSCPGPEDIYLGIRGLKTLGIRLKKHQENAMKIIEWLLRQKEVNRVLYPALPDNPGYKIWKKDFDFPRQVMNFLAFHRCYI